MTTQEPWRGLPKVNFSQGSGFQKWRSPSKALLNEFTPSNTLAWKVGVRQEEALYVCKATLVVRVCSREDLDANAVITLRARPSA